MGDEITDDALLARATRGDEVAFLRIYERHRDAVYRFVRRLSGLPELAEDVTQDCFLGLIEHPSRYQPSRASLRTFLCAVARNRAITRLRREGRESSLEEDREEEAWVTRPVSGPLDGVLGEERQAAVADALARLPLPQREAIILFEYEGLTLAETAAVAATDVGTIKSRLHRARERLRRSLARYRAAPAAIRTTGGR